MANARLYAFWGSLTEGLRTGQPQNEAKAGGDFFAALYADPTARAVPARDDRAQPRGAAQAIAAKFPWRDYAACRRRLRPGRRPGRRSRWRTPT